jgi:hypothetical protein
VAIVSEVVAGWNLVLLLSGIGHVEKGTHLVHAFEDGPVVCVLGLMNDILDVPLGLETKRQECLDLTGDQESAINACVIQWLYPKSIPRGENETALQVVKNECEFASKVEEQS